MASFVGAITEFNPYIQQIPTEAYTKVGMFKEQQYEAGVAKVQDSIDKIMGLDIANEGGRQYLRARVDELTNSLNKYSAVDFSNPNNVAQLSGLAKPLYQDENIVNDVVNTSIYRKWSKEANDAYKAGKMELGQYMRETTDANTWLNSKAAGAQYTGRQTANTATKKDLLDRVIKAKKDGMEKNEFVYDTNYSKDTPYYVKSTNKYYSEADFNNFIANNVMSNRDREMLMNDHWYENMGKPAEVLQQEDLAMYTAKIEANNREIDKIKNDPLLYAGERKVEAQRTIDDLTAYNQQLRDGKIDYLQKLNLNDPTTKDVFHRDLSEARFINSLNVLRDQVRKEELVKNEQWFLEKAAELEAAKEAAKAGKVAEDKKKPIQLIDEVAVYTPVDPNAPKTELSLNTIQTGYQIKNDQINQAMTGMIGKLMQNGVDMKEFMEVDATGNLVWDQVQVGNKAGASVNVPKFKSQEAKDKFYGMVAGLNYAFTKEAEDGFIDNKSFTDFIKQNFAGYVDNDPNSKFKLEDKIISDAMNTLKGTSALIPKLEGLFADKGIVRSMAQIDEALKGKKDMANAYREAIIKSNTLSTSEREALERLTDDQLLGQQSIIDLKAVQAKAGKAGEFNENGQVEVIQESDGSYSIGEVFAPVVDGKRMNDTDRSWWQKSGRELLGRDIPAPRYDRRFKTGFKNKEDAEKALNSATKYGDKIVISGIDGISNEALVKADNFVKQTYSYIQENVASTVQNWKQDKEAYAAGQDALALFINSAKIQATPNDILIENGAVDPRALTGISKVEVLGATISNTEDIFNPNPMYHVQFEANVPGEDGKEAKKLLTAQVSVKSFLATNPNFRTSAYAKYFAPILYAQKDAQERIKATVNPLEGSQASYANRDNIEPVYQTQDQQGRSTFRPDTDTEIAWETIPIEKGGRQTMISYQVASLGQNTTLGNVKNRDGQTYAPGAFYVKLKVPTSTGKPKVIFLKNPNGDSYSFNSPANAHYAIRELILNNPDVQMDDIDPRTGLPDYFTTNPNTIRGIINAQLSYNGFAKLDPVKIKDAIGKEEIKYQANQLQFGAR